jgi:hypothetical protein
MKDTKDTKQGKGGTVTRTLKLSVLPSSLYSGERGWG